MIPTATPTDPVNIEGKADFDPMYDASVQETILGVPINIGLITDRSLEQKRIKEIRIHKGHYNDEDGLPASKSIANFVAKAFYQVCVQSKINEDVLPERVWGITEFDYAWVKTKRGSNGRYYGVTNLEPLVFSDRDDFGFAQGTNLNGTTLIQYMGIMSDGRELNATGRFMTIVMAQSSEWLATGNVESTAVDDFIRQGLGTALSNRHKSYDFHSVFKVYPENSEERHNTAD